MNKETQSNQTPKPRLWTSYILQGVVVIMFLMGAMMNIFQSEDAVNGAMEMGYPESSVFLLGIILLLATLLYAIPKTAALGAILLTAWLGGAVATHTIHRDPMINTLFPAIFGVLVWLAIGLRDERFKSLMK